MNWALRGCLIGAAALVALLGFGVGFCGLMLSGGGYGHGVVLVGVLMIAAAVVLFVVALRGARRPPEVLRLAVYRSGRVTADGREVDPAYLPNALASLRGKDGIVWLYREGAADERHPNAALVARAIADEHLPLSLTSRPDFSDVLSADGTTRPR